MANDEPPSPISKGGISKKKLRVEVRWSVNGKRKSKGFRVTKKRTIEQALELATAFHNDIQEKHRLWMEYITPIRKEKKKEYYKQRDQLPERKAYHKEYRQRPEVKAMQKARKKEYRQRPEVKARNVLARIPYNQRKCSQKYTCECGLVLTLGSKARHFKSQMHQDYLEKHIKAKTK